MKFQVLVLSVLLSSLSCKSREFNSETKSLPGTNSDLEESYLLAVNASGHDVALEVASEALSKTVGNVNLGVAGYPEYISKQIVLLDAELKAKNINQDTYCISKAAKYNFLITLGDEHVSKSALKKEFVDRARARLTELNKDCVKPDNTQADTAMDVALIDAYGLSAKEMSNRLVTAKELQKRGRVSLITTQKFELAVIQSAKRDICSELEKIAESAMGDAKKMQEAGRLTKEFVERVETRFYETDLLMCP